MYFAPVVVRCVHCGAVRFECEESCHKYAVVDGFREERLFEALLHHLPRETLSNDSQVLNAELQVASMTCDSTRECGSGLMTYPGHGYTMLYIAGSPVVHRVGSPGFFFVDQVSERVDRRALHPACIRAKQYLSEHNRLFQDYKQISELHARAQITMTNTLHRNDIGFITENVDQLHIGAVTLFRRQQVALSDESALLEPLLYPLLFPHGSRG